MSASREYKEGERGGGEGGGRGSQGGLSYSNLGVLAGLDTT